MEPTQKNVRDFLANHIIYFSLHNGIHICEEDIDLFIANTLKMITINIIKLSSILDDNMFKDELDALFTDIAKTRHKANLENIHKSLKNDMNMETGVSEYIDKYLKIKPYLKIYD